MSTSLDLGGSDSSVNGMLSVEEATFDFHRAVRRGSDLQFFAHGVVSDDELTLFCLDCMDFNLIHSITCLDDELCQNTKITYQLLRNKGNQTPKALKNYGSVIYYQEKLVLWGDSVNILWTFDITTRMWSKDELTGQIPHARECHAFIKYDKFALIFGGRSSSNTNCTSPIQEDMSGFYVIDLDTLICKRIFSSKVCGGDFEIIGIPQMINDTIVVIHGYQSQALERGYYHIDMRNVTAKLDSGYQDDVDFEFSTEIPYGHIIAQNVRKFISNNDGLVFYDKNGIYAQYETYSPFLARDTRMHELSFSETLSDVYGYWIKDRFVWIGKCKLKGNRRSRQNYIFYASNNVICEHDDSLKCNPKVSLTNPFRHCNFKMPILQVSGWRNNTKYQLITTIGQGATSVVYDAIIRRTSFKFISFMKQHGIKRNQIIVVKQQKSFTESENKEIQEIKHDTVTSEKTKLKGLFREYEILKLINNTNHCKDITCKLYEMFIENNIPHLVLSRLGVSLQHLFVEFGCKFSLSQVCMILNQMILMLFKLHSIGYVHNDIKPENVLIDRKSKSNQRVKLHLIDFGLCTPFWDFNKNKHIEQESTQGKFEGTFRFSSRNHHCFEINQSRRDDLESAIYMTIYLRKNSLPWIIDDEEYKQDGMDQIAKVHSKTKQLKLESKISDICKDMPSSFETALNYIWNLRFDQCPDYCYLQSLVSSSASDNEPVTPFGMVRQHGDLHFIGARIRHAQQIEEKQHVEASFAENDTILQPLFQNQSLSKSIIAKYSKATKLSSNLTKKNYRTYLSVHGLRTRKGYLIKSLIIDKGVPKNKPTQDYGGIIVFEQVTVRAHDQVLANKSNRIVLNGHIYVLPVRECKKINQEYNEQLRQTPNKIRLQGRIHGAIYYNFFQENIHETVLNNNDNNQNNAGSGEKLSLIRGFSVFGNPNRQPISYKHNSRAFNFADTNFC